MDIIAILYAIVGFVFSGACVPQLRRLMQDETGAASISLMSWAMFSACNVITLSYALTHSADRLFILCAVLCTIGNLSVFLMACYRRSRFVRCHVENSHRLYY